MITTALASYLNDMNEKSTRLLRRARRLVRKAKNNKFIEQHLSLPDRPRQLEERTHNTTTQERVQEEWLKESLARLRSMLTRRQYHEMHHKMPPAAQEPIREATKKAPARFMARVTAQEPVREAMKKAQARFMTVQAARAAEAAAEEAAEALRKGTSRVWLELELALRTTRRRTAATAREEALKTIEEACTKLDMLDAARATTRRETAAARQAARKAALELARELERSRSSALVLVSYNPMDLYFHLFVDEDYLMVQGLDLSYLIGRTAEDIKYMYIDRAALYGTKETSNPFSEEERESLEEAEEESRKHFLNELRLRLWLFLLWLFECLRIRALSFRAHFRPFKGKRYECTTMPWTVWPSLVVLWGVCWMFYGSPLAARSDIPAWLDRMDTLGDDCNAPISPN